MRRVSVLIPSYNHAEFLRTCLDSIFAQTYTDFEVIVIDDGSTDDSVAIACAYTDREPRLRILWNEENLGTYGTLQRALEIAQGEFVAVMNSDDLWHRDKLAQQVALLDQNPDASLCYVLGWMVDKEGKEIEGEDVHLDWPRTERQEVLPHLLHENRILASGVLFRREGLRFEATCRYSGDWVALLERTREHPVVCVPRRLTFWRQHDHNTYTRSVKQMREEIRVRRAILADAERWFQPQFDPQAVRAGLMKNACVLSLLYIYFGEFSAARGALRQAMHWGYSRKSGFKRSLATYLPTSLVRLYFWRGEAFIPSLKALRKEPREIPPFEFR